MNTAALLALLDDLEAAARHFFEPRGGFRVLARETPDEPDPSRAVVRFEGADYDGARPRVFEIVSARDGGLVTLRTYENRNHWTPRDFATLRLQQAGHARA